MWKNALFIFLFSLPAWAYNVTQDFSQGFYWENLPINIKVVESDSNKKNTLEKLARDAIGEWESRTGLSLWSLTGSGTTNAIRWSNNFATETRMDPSSVLAVAIRHATGPYFAKVEIVINGSHPLNYDLTHLLTTLTHELGHTMGLDHSGESFAVMAPTLQDPYRGLHNDDIQGITFTHNETQHRQQIGYISPLAYEKTESSQPLSCATVGVVGVGGTAEGLLSLASGMLIAFVRKIILWFKSRL